VTAADLTQRLAAILAADVAGYSRLMSLDEHATVAALEAARAVFRERVASSRGRVIDTAGDSVLAVFETATGAVAAALAIQAELAGLVAEAPDDRRMRFRIGVHLGDVMEKADGTVYGDGVNIAARLQALAEPGGITVSESIRTEVRGKVGASFTDQGPRPMKNIDEPVRAYRVEPESGVTRESTRETDETSLPLPDRSSVAVLPFTNMSGDPEQEYFADGIVEDITTELSRFSRLFVIARNTSFTYKGRSVDVRQVARELGVHFVLEGSVRRSGDRVRVSAQLIDGETGRRVWAERYEDVLSDVFELQERITRQVVGSMVPELEAEEMRLLERGRRRFTEADDTAWRAFKALLDAIFIGDAALAAEALRLAERAVEQDRACCMAWYVLARSHSTRVVFGWSDDRQRSLAAAQRAAETLMTLAPGDSRSYQARGQIALLSGDLARGAADQRRAYELNPNDTTTTFILSWTEAAAGNVARARELAAQAIRMSPKDRLIGFAYLARALSAFIERDLPKVREWAELAIQSHPAAPVRRMLLIAYAAETGDTGLLRTHLEKLRSVAPDFVPSVLRGDYRPFHRPEHLALLLDSLRKVGLEA
jgi:adenylate cyclase